MCLFCLLCMFIDILIKRGKLRKTGSYTNLISKMKTNKQKMQVLILSYLFLSLATFTVAVITKQRIRKKRQWKVRPINRNRIKEGVFSTLVKDMIMSDEEQFFKYTRMTINQFNHLHELIKLDIQKDKKKSHISAKERLIITLQ